MIPLPFKGSYPITQRFGQNLNNYYQADGLKGHQGIDFGCPNGTPVYSSVNGTVIATSTDLLKGWGVAVLSTDKFQYKNKECFLDTIYWHLKENSLVVKIGDVVKAGDLLGLSNNTGRTTGPHLHFSIIPLETDGSRKPLEEYGNGYHSCVDPAIWLDIPDPLLKYKELQILLNKYGANLVVDGKFGPLSKKALANFLAQ